MNVTDTQDWIEDLRQLPDGSLTAAEVGVLLNRLEMYRSLAEDQLNETEQLRSVLSHPIIEACIGMNGLQFPELAPGGKNDE